MVHQVALHLCPLHPFPFAAKGTGTHSLSRKALLRNLPLTVYLTHGLVDHLLAERVHEALGRGRVKALRGTAQLANALLDGALRLIKTGLGCCQAGLLGCFKGSAHTLAKPRLLRGLLRHHRCRSSIPCCALQALHGLTEIRGPSLPGRAHGLAQRHVLGHEPRLAGSLRCHANGLLALAKALLHGLLCLAKLWLSGLQLSGRLAEQGL